MLFNSLEFLIFLPVTVALYYLLPHRFRWIFLLLASCVFYMAFVPKYILILFAVILIDYVAAIVIEQAQTERNKKMWLTFSLIANLSLLAFFKYFNFLNDNLSWLAAKLGHGNPIPYLHIILPLGLSFHTFQSMGYTIDVYHRKQKAERHLGYYSLFVLFFPQMVAGPIERFRNLGEQLKQKVILNYRNMSHGFRFILFGLFIKMVVADNLGEYANQVYAETYRFDYSSVLYTAVFYSFQLYADFYGYSTIAIGAAK
ncbi:MAG: MBOAT family O-acyltransferase, partial [Bacteroidia bacterium]